MGVLQWSPSEFWKASPYDLLAAVQGWREAHGGEVKDKQSEDDLEEIREMRRGLNAYNKNLDEKRKPK